MTTVMTAGNSEGTRRCDATCHDAKGSKCECICGGRNHGVGFERAMENTVKYGKAVLEELAEGGDKFAREVLGEVRAWEAERAGQRELFGGERS